METISPKFGKNIIEMLMFNMYDECKVIYREYVQNSYDAIIQAVEKGILPNIEHGMVAVNIDSKHRCVTISDNGTGIELEKAVQTLTNIAASEKDGVSQAGQYGVGRLVGAGFCSKITFKTKAKGEDKGTEVSLDSEMARNIIRDRNDQRDAVAVMKAISSVSIYDDKADSHYFKVELVNIKEGYDMLLSEPDILSYLSSVAPVDFSLTFKNLLVNKNKTFKEYYSKLKFVQLAVNKKDVKKQYGTTVIGTKDKILDIEVFELKDSDQDLAWGWYAVTPFTKEIPEVFEDKIEPNRGIRLRKNNIQIGDAKLLDKFFSEPRGNHYFYGEIHINNRGIVPDSTRQGLASTHEALSFYEQLRNKFLELKKVYYMASELKRAVRDLGVGVAKVKSEDVNVDKKEGEAEVEKALNTISKAEGKDLAQTQAGISVIDYYKEQADNVQKSGGVKVESTKPKTGTKQHQIVTSDELEPLYNKYSPETIKTIKKIFALFRKKCGLNEKPTLEKTIGEIIKNLSK